MNTSRRPQENCFIHLLCIASGILLASSASAQLTRDQTDWSGGPGERGPVDEWMSNFDTERDLAWRSIPGQFTIAMNRLGVAEQHGIRADSSLTQSVAVADIDGDRDDDFITTDPVTNVFEKDGAIYWWKRLADGKWRHTRITNDFYGARYAAGFDVDRDGDTDVIAAAYYGVGGDLNRNGRFAWFENLNGDGSDWRQHLVGDYFWGANHIDAGDFDGDGDIDLTGASELTDGIYEQDGDLVWFENMDGNGLDWQLHELDVDFPNASHAQAVDLDLDGDLDIAAGNSNSLGRSNLHWWENELGDASVWTKRVVPGSFWGSGYLDVGDLDDDGDLDLIGGGYGTAALFWWENRDGEGTDWLGRTVDVFPSGHIVHLADVDGDGDLDCVAAGENSGQWGGLWWYENQWNTNGSWSIREIKHNTGSGPWIAVGDLNGDGRLDALASCEDPYRKEENEIAWYDLTSFRADGALTSSILDGGADPQWDAIEWDADRRIDSDLTVAVRASDDPDNLGDFIDIVGSGDRLADYVDPSARYLQYRVSMTRRDDGTAPILREIRVGPAGTTGLRLSDPVPGTAGQMNQMTARWDESGERVLFAYGLAIGRTNVPGCTNLALDLRNAKLVGTVVTDSNGEATLDFFVPDKAAGQTVHFQALVKRRCDVSEVRTITFQ